MQQFMNSHEKNAFPEYHSSPILSFLVAIGQLPAQYLKVIARPSVKTLSSEVPKARWSIVVAQFLGLVALTIAFNTVGHYIPTAALHTITALKLDSFGLFDWLPAPFNGIVFILATFLIGLFTAYPFSKLSGGEGKFVEHTYLLLLFTVPLVAISGILPLIPTSGSLAPLVIGIVGVLFLYRMFLHVLTIMAVHLLYAERATLIVLIIPMVLLIIGVIIGVIIFAIVMTDGNIFDFLDGLDIPSSGRKKKKRNI